MKLEIITVAAVAVLLSGMILVVGGCKAHTKSGDAAVTAALRDQQIARLEEFSKAKKEEAQTLADKGKEKISPEFQGFFDAAIKGDGP